jgi:hypothetical protein
VHILCVMQGEKSRNFLVAKARFGLQIALTCGATG